MQKLLKTCEPTESIRQNSICVCVQCLSAHWFCFLMENHEKNDLKKIRLVFNMDSSFKTHDIITFNVYFINVKLNIFLISDGRKSCTRAARTLRKAASTSLHDHIRTLWHSVFNYRNPSVGITVKYLLKGRKRGRAQDGNSGWKGKG